MTDVSGDRPTNENANQGDRARAGRLAALAYDHFPLERFGTCSCGEHMKHPRGGGTFYSGEWEKSWAEHFADAERPALSPTEAQIEAAARVLAETDGCLGEERTGMRCSRCYADARRALEAAFEAERPAPCPHPNWLPPVRGGSPVWTCEKCGEERAERPEPDLAAVIQQHLEVCTSSAVSKRALRVAIHPEEYPNG